MTAEHVVPHVATFDQATFDRAALIEAWAEYDAWENRREELKWEPTFSTAPHARR